jgi:hemoglobin/transferrin/lactoferrin receptor protein
LAITSYSAADESALEPLETVTITARRPQAIARATGAVSVVSSQEIAFTCAHDLRDVAAYEPGLSARSDPGRFGLESVAIRGIGGNRVAIELDRVPISKAFAIGSFASAGRTLPDFSLLERIEILRGPASVLHGSDALGGVISASTWQPRQWLARMDSHTAAVARAGFDSVDRTYSVGLQAGTSTQRTAVLAALEHRDGHERELAAFGAANPREFRGTSATLRASFGNAATPLELGFAFDRLAQRTDLIALRGLPGRFATTTNIVGDDSGERASAFVAKSFGTRTRGWGSVEMRAYLLHSEATQSTDETRRAAPPRQPSALAIERVFVLTQRHVGLELTVSRQLDVGRFEHQLVWGIDANRAQIREHRDAQQQTLMTGAITHAILGEVFPLRDFPITNMREVGVFIEDEITRSGSRWSLQVGARHDDFRLDPRPDAMWLADNPIVGAVATRHQAWSPRIGFTWQFSPSVRAFGTLSRGFRAPPFEDVNIGLDLPSVGVRALPNPQLQPEESNGLELGVRAQGDAASGTISVFDTRYRNLIESKVNLGRDPASGLTLFQSQNRSRARIVGAEVNLHFDLGAWTATLDGWSARFGGSWLDGRDTSREAPLNQVDPTKLTLGLRYQSSAASPAIEARITNVAAKHDIEQPSSGAPLYASAGYASVDLFGSLKLGRNVTARISVANLFDRRYAEWSTVRGRTIDDPLLPLYFSSGRSVAIGVDWQL